MTTPGRGLYIPSLDGLRCIAITVVFLSHAMNAAEVARIVPGHFGVTLFFFLSGYLITTLMRMETERTGTVSIRNFYIRRALRIFPTFYLVLLLAAIYGFQAGLVDPWFLLGQVLHLTNYEMVAAGWKAPIAPFTDVYWSLAVEEHFYLAFPALFVFMWRRMPREQLAIWLLGFCAAILVWRCLLVHLWAVPYDRTYMATDTRIDAILFGCVLALRGNPVLDPTRLSEATWKKRLFPASIVILLASLLVRNREFRESIGYTIQAMCLFPVFITVVRYPDWGIVKLLNLPAVKWIGLLSYAIYLIHPAMLAIAEAMVGKSLWPLSAVALVLTVSVAALMYYGIERPIGRLRQRFSAAKPTPGPAGIGHPATG